MTPMLEKIARAMVEARYGTPDRTYVLGNGTERPEWPRWVDEARAALLAIREPDEAMVEAGGGHCYPDGSGHDDAFTAMIDFVLAEGPHK